MPPQSVKNVHHVPQNTPDTRIPTQEDMQRPSQQQTLPNKAPWVAPFLINRFKPIYKNQDPYVSSSLLNKVQFSVVEMSFRTGATKRGEQFIQPMSPQDVAGLLARTKPFDNSNNRSDFVGEESINEPSNFPQVEARFLWSFINACLHTSDDPDGYGRTISPNYTTWRFYSNSFEKLNRITRIDYGGFKRVDIEWQVQKLGQPCLPYPDKFTHDRRRDELLVDRPLDHSKPHFTCFLTNHNDLVDGKLTTGEVTTALYLALEQAMGPYAQSHRIFPVTVVCGSSRTVRVVQGVLDTQKQSFELRVTRPVHFRKGARANWEEFLTLLGWIIGDPVGRTS